jgi:hypothetical protein
MYLDKVIEIWTYWMTGAVDKKFYSVQCILNRFYLISKYAMNWFQTVPAPLTSLFRFLGMLLSQSPSTLRMFFGFRCESNIASMF